MRSNKIINDEDEEMSYLTMSYTVSDTVKTK